jgi:HSP20 family protein
MIYRRIFGFPGWEQRNPFAELERMRRQMDQLFEGLSGAQTRQPAGVFPLVNLTENRDAFMVRAELPGITAGELDIQATGNSVTLSGARRIPEENGSARYHRREREAGAFSRVIGLPAEINPDKVEARLQNGVLTVVLPKAEAAKPKQISVR